MEVICPKCKGSGLAVVDNEAVDCPTCDGDGFIVK